MGRWVTMTCLAKSGNIHVSFRFLVVAEIKLTEHPNGICKISATNKPVLYCLFDCMRTLHAKSDQIPVSSTMYSRLALFARGKLGCIVDLHDRDAIRLDIRKTCVSGFGMAEVIDLSVCWIAVQRKRLLVVSSESRLVKRASGAYV